MRLEVTGLSSGNSLLQKCKVRLHTVQQAALFSCDFEPRARVQKNRQVSNGRKNTRNLLPQVYELSTASSAVSVEITAGWDSTLPFYTISYLTSALIEASSLSYRSNKRKKEKSSQTGSKLKAGSSVMTSRKELRLASREQ
ncbi:hypothetical protein HAX54_025128 [Datura stramonium]|uniref:Uncharacterized protein n=1 Tax=Datura stramonium TaxID=4076 RepID=A0ABS8S6W7_DATST|nr:hypothetical protein [Datura stramonium]